MTNSLKQVIKNVLSTEEFALLYNYSIVKKIVTLGEISGITRQTATEKLKVLSERVCRTLNQNCQLITKEYLVPNTNTFDMPKFYRELGKKASVAIIVAIEYANPKDWQYLKEFDVLIYDTEHKVSDDINAIVDEYIDCISPDSTYDILLSQLKSKYIFMSDLGLTRFLNSRALKVKNGFIVSIADKASMQVIVPYTVKHYFADIEIDINDDDIINRIKDCVIKNCNLVSQKLSPVTVRRYITRYIPIYSAHTYLYKSLTEIDKYLDAINVVSNEVGNYRLRWTDLYSGFQNIWQSIDINNHLELHHLIAQLTLDRYIQTNVNQYCVQLTADDNNSVFKPIEDYLKQEGAGQFISRDELYMISDERNVDRFFAMPIKNKANLYRTKGTVIDLSTIKIKKSQVNEIRNTINKMLKNSEYGYINIYDVHESLNVITKKLGINGDRYLFHLLMYLFPKYKYHYPGIIEPKNGLTADEIINNVIKPIGNKKDQIEKGYQIFNKAYKEKIRTL